MKHLKKIANPQMNKAVDCGCGECRSSCQSACKTSATVGNQKCDRKVEKK